MRIGIDIDDTLTDVKEKLNFEALKYAKSIGKNIDNINNDIVDVHNDGGIYQQLFGFSYNELKYFLKDIQENITDNAAPRVDAVNSIYKLKSEGHKIIIITARDLEFHNDPYNQSKEWLEKNNIYYDKLIVNARNKKDICDKEKIDLLIDDSLSNCLNVISLGIKTIRVCEEKYKDNRIISFTNWNDIYNYINHIKTN